DSVFVAVNDGVFEEFAVLNAAIEGGLIEEIIIDTIAFTVPRRAGCAGDNAGHFRVMHQKLLAQRRFAAARWSGNNDEKRMSFRLGHGYSTFWTCSRNFSNSVLSATTSREISASFA